MQWASSTATSAGVRRASASGNPGTPSRSGAMNRKSSRPSSAGAEGALREPAVAARVDALGAQAQALELGHLVFHEGDERRDHEGGSAAREAGELVAERLARARGHHQQHVLALGHGPAHGLLPRAEGLEAEGRAQQFLEALGPVAIRTLGLAHGRWASRAAAPMRWATPLLCWRRRSSERWRRPQDRAHRTRARWERSPRARTPAQRRGGARARPQRGAEATWPGRRRQVRHVSADRVAERAAIPPASVAPTSARTWSSILRMKPGEVGLPRSGFARAAPPTRR